LSRQKNNDVLKKDPNEEQAFGKWLEKNNLRIAKKLMTDQMRKGKKGRQKQVQQKEKQQLPCHNNILHDFPLCSRKAG
jgi:hypothetical protein